MASADLVKAKLNNLIARSNEKTGRQDTTLSGAVDALIAGYGQGGGGITPTGTINITANGTYDVTSYAKADVAIPGVDGDIEADSLSKLHYWEKYVLGDSGIIETEVSSVTVSYKSASATSWPNIQYAGEIVNNDGSLSLLNPTTVALNFDNRDIIIGKYIRAYDYKFYRVPADATTSIFTSQYGSSVYASQAYQLAGVAVGEPLGVVVSADPTAYPKDGEQDGYRYVYKGTLGAYSGELPALSNPGAASDLATGKQLIDGSGNIVTGSLFEVTSGNTLYANNNPALSWRTDGKVETVGTYGVAGNGDGGIVRPGSKFAIRVPAEQYGNATAADVTAGKTFTSAAGLKVVGTGTGGGGSGLVMKTGTTTSNVIDTGLSDIQLFVLYNPVVAAAGLMQGIYRKDTGKTNYTYCLSYSSTIKQFSTATDEKGVVSGGVFTWNGSGYAVLSENTEYNWIAVGTA